MATSDTAGIVTEISLRDSWILSMLATRLRNSRPPASSPAEGAAAALQKLIDELSPAGKPIGLALAGRAPEPPTANVSQAVDALRTWAETLRPGWQACESRRKVRFDDLRSRRARLRSNA